MPRPAHEFWDLLEEIVYVLYNTEPGEDRLDVIPSFLDSLYPDIDSRLADKIEMIALRILMIMETTHHIDFRREDE